MSAIDTMKGTMIPFVFLLECLIIFHFSGEIRGESTTIVPAENVTILLDSLLEGYDKRLRPNYGGQSIDINVSMLIYSFGPITESKMEYTMDMYFRQEWLDPRLTFNQDVVLYLTSEMSSRLWVPDTYFINEKAAKYHEITSKNSLLRISRDGKLLYSTRLTMTASCSMDLKLFPFDKQNCKLTLESYAYNTIGVHYYWLKNGAVWIDPEISLPQFEVQGYSIEGNTATYYVGNYSQLIINFYLGRQISYYVIQTYIPSSIIVIVSWVSFWIPRKATPARVALGVTTVLTMTTIMGNAGSSLPKLSYMKAIDIFLGVCHIYVFAALVEFALISFYDSPSFEQARQLVKEARGTKEDEVEMHQRGQSNGTNGDVRITVADGEDVIEGEVTVNDSDQNILQQCICSSITKCKQKLTETGFEPDSTEHKARVLFPLSFVIFQAVYWIYFLFIAHSSPDVAGIIS